MFVFYAEQVARGMFNFLMLSKWLEACLFLMLSSWLRFYGCKISATFLRVASIESLMCMRTLKVPY